MIDAQEMPTKQSPNGRLLYFYQEEKHAHKVPHGGLPKLAQKKTIPKIPKSHGLPCPSKCHTEVLS